MTGVSHLLPLNLMIIEQVYIIFLYIPDYRLLPLPLLSYPASTTLPECQAYEASISEAWESRKNDTPTVESINIKYIDTYLQLVKNLIEKTHM